MRQLLAVKLTAAIDFMGDMKGISHMSVDMYSIYTNTSSSTLLNKFILIFSLVPGRSPTLHQLTHHGRYVIYIKEQLFSEAELISQKYVSDTQDRSYKLNGTSVSFRKTLDSWGSLLGSTVESKARLGR